MDDEKNLVLVDARTEARVLTLNRPDKLNAANAPLQSQLVDRLREAGSDPSVKAVVLTGRGRAFCAGGDLLLLQERMSGRPTDPSVAKLHADIGLSLQAIEVPLIAAVNGPAVGMGAEFVAYCDIVIMSENAYLCEPHVRFGMGPLPGIRTYWQRRTSPLVVNELIMTGRRIGADEAVRLGLANRMTANGHALETALALAVEMAALPIAGLKAAKRALRPDFAGDVCRSRR